MEVYVVVLVFIVMDIVTGFAKALFTGTVDSSRIREGGMHKFSEVVTVTACGMAEFGLRYIDFGIDIPILGVAASYICMMESVSIMENLCEMNPELRELFAPYLAKLKGKKNDSE